MMAEIANYLAKTFIVGRIYTEVGASSQKKLIVILNIFMVTSVACFTDIVFYSSTRHECLCRISTIRNYCNVYSSSFLIVYGM